jgi:homoserine dehydrogenase
VPSVAERRPRLALFGLGGVGRALLELFDERSTPVELVAASDSRGTLEGAFSPAEVLRHKAQGLPAGRVEPAELLARVRADIVVDLTSCSFATGEPAAGLLRAGLEAGASVVTANKAPLARNWSALHAIAARDGLRIGYAGAAGAALPAVAVAQALGRADRIESIEGVLTGTSSYVLARVAGGETLHEAITGAQAAGIAEPDPSLDLGGWDTAAKLVILANTVWDGALSLDDVAVTGIDETSIAGLEGVAVHLIGRAERRDGAVVAEVRPRGIDADHPLAALRSAEKGVSLSGPGIGRVTVSGGRSSPRGAATAVLGDVMQIVEEYR